MLLLCNNIKKVSTYVNVKGDEDILSMQGFTMGEMTARAELFIEAIELLEKL